MKRGGFGESRSISSDVASGLAYILKHVKSLVGGVDKDIKG